MDELVAKKRHSWLMPLLGALLVLALTALAAYAVNRAGDAVQHERAERAASRIEGRVRNQIRLLDATAGLFRAEDVTDRASFQRFLSAIDPAASAPGMQGIGLAMRDDGTARAKIKQFYGIDRAIWPASNSAVRYPIVLLEPGDDRNMAALGYDMYSEPARRAAMEKAIACDCSAASDIVELVQEIDGPKQPGFLVYRPNYARNDPNHLVGFVYAPFRIHDLMKATIDPELESGINVHLIAGPNSRGQDIFKSGEIGKYAERFPIKVADRTWTLEVDFSKEPWAVRTMPLTWLAGTMLAGLVAFLIWMQARRAEIARALANERTQRAHEQQLMLQELAHRQKNSIARVNSIINLTARETDDMETFKKILEGRVASLAAAQSQLLGEGNTGDLETMIREEIDRAGFSKHVTISGPEVEVSERQSQPLALTFHELVTNAVKYGAFKNGGSIAINWCRNGDGVELDWSENGLNGTPAADQEGFGTKLVRNLIERQLKGKFERITAPGQFTTRIGWPA